MSMYRCAWRATQEDGSVHQFSSPEYHSLAEAIEYRDAMASIVNAAWVETATWTRISDAAAQHLLADAGLLWDAPVTPRTFQDSSD